MKPKVKNRPYLDWIELKKYFGTKYPEIDCRKVISLLADGGGVHNGCYQTFENPEGCENLFEPEIAEFSKVLFTEFPDAENEYGDISVWIWW